MRPITSSWWQGLLVCVFVTTIMTVLLIPASALADTKPQTKTCFAWVICNTDKPDKHVDQSVQPGPEFNKLSKKGQDYFTRNCFSVHYDYVVRRDMCGKYFPGYTWADPKKNWSLQTATDPVRIGTNAAKAAASSAVGGWVQDGLESLTKSAAQSVSSFIKDEFRLINHSTSPAFTARWFETLYGEIFGFAFFIAIAAMALRVTKSGMPNKDSADVVKGPIALIAFGVCGVFLPGAIALVVWVNDTKIAPGFMGATTKQVDHLIYELTNNLDNLANTGIAWLGLFLILLAGIIGGIIVEFMLYVRELMIYVLTPVEVIALAMWVGGSDRLTLLWTNTLALAGWILLPTVMSVITFIAVNLVGAHEGANPAILGSLALIGMPLIASWLTRRFTSVDLWFHAKQTRTDVVHHTTTAVNTVRGWRSAPVEVG
jgi:hypothetical protein